MSVNKVIQYLELNGPTRFSELPREFTRNDRYQGGARLSPDFRSSNADIESYRSESVAYLFEEHTKEEIAQEWANANSDIVESYDDRSFLSTISTNIGKDWVEPFREAINSDTEKDERKTDRTMDVEPETILNNLLDDEEKVQELME